MTARRAREVRFPKLVAPTREHYATAVFKPRLFRSREHLFDAILAMHGPKGLAVFMAWAREQSPKPHEMHP